MAATLAAADDANPITPGGPAVATRLAERVRSAGRAPAAGQDAGRVRVGRRLGDPGGRVDAAHHFGTDARDIQAAECARHGLPPARVRTSRPVRAQVDDLMTGRGTDKRREQAGRPLDQAGESGQGRPSGGLVPASAHGQAVTPAVMPWEGSPPPRVLRASALTGLRPRSLRLRHRAGSRRGIDRRLSGPDGTRPGAPFPPTHNCLND